jgi:hypothetical protein
MAPAPWKVFHARRPRRDRKFLQRDEMTQLYRPCGVESGVAMKANKNQPEDAWESDPVWNLIDAAPAPKASPRFTENALRAARNSSPNVSWWKSLFAPAPLAGLGTAAALAALAVAFFPSSDNAPFPDDSALSAEIEEVTDMENLIASIDHIDELSDSELIALIGY